MLTKTIVEFENGTPSFSCATQTARNDWRRLLCPCVPLDDGDADGDARAAGNDERSDASCAAGSELRFGRCMPCAFGTYGGGGSARCAPCPPLRPRTYHARLGAVVASDCAVACSSGDEPQGDTEHCLPQHRAKLSPRLCVLAIAMAIFFFTCGQSLRQVLAVVRRQQFSKALAERVKTER